MVKGDLVQQVALVLQVESTKRQKNHVLFWYIIKELTLYFVIAFLFFFLIFFVNQILLTAEDLLKKKAPFLQVMKLMTYSFPFIIAQSAPFATLVGFLMCLGRMMSDNEVLVFRATGNHYRTVLFPVITLAIVISLVSFFVNDYLIPLGQVKYYQLYREILASNPSVELESNSIKRTESSTLVIGTVDDRTVSDIILFDVDRNDTQRIIVAGNSYIASPEDPGIVMQLEMQDAVAVFMDKQNALTFDYLLSNQMVMNLFTESIYRSSSSSRKNPRELTAIDLYRELQRMKTEQKTSQRTINSWDLEFNKKFSLPFGSLFFAMIALPLAFLFGKHNGQTIGLIIGIVICVAYWAMMLMGETFSYKIGFSGFVTMWLPNALIGSVALILYLRLLRK